MKNGGGVNKRYLPGHLGRWSCPLGKWGERRGRNGSRGQQWEMRASATIMLSVELSISHSKTDVERTLYT